MYYYSKKCSISFYLSSNYCPSLPDPSKSYIIKIYLVWNIFFPTKKKQNKKTTKYFFMLSWCTSECLELSCSCIQ